MTKTPMDRGMKASAFLKRRNQLLETLAGIDGAITATLKKRRTQKAADEARQLFEARQLIADALEDEFGLPTDTHPAVWSLPDRKES